MSHVIQTKAKQSWQIHALNYLYQKQTQYIVTPTWITKEERQSAIEFISSQSYKLNYTIETLLLAVNIFDRFVSKVNRSNIGDKMILVCCGCLYLAAKYEESIVCKSHLDHLKSVSNTSRSEILNAERVIWNIIDHDLGYANPLHFLRIVSIHCEDADPETRNVAKYLLELTSLHTNINSFTACTIALGCLLAARVILNKNPIWTDLHIEFTHTKQTDLTLICEVCYDMISFSSKDFTSYQKYHGISEICFVRKDVLIAYVNALKTSSPLHNIHTPHNGL